jgi:hypothetical protein
VRAFLSLVCTNLARHVDEVFRLFGSSGLGLASILLEVAPSKTTDPIAVVLTGLVSQVVTPGELIRFRVIEQMAHPCRDR